MGKTQGAITKNKTIFWRATLMTNSGIKTIEYRDLKTLCMELHIHRSNVYRIYNGYQVSSRKKNILAIEKFKSVCMAETGVGLSSV